MQDTKTRWSYLDGGSYIDMEVKGDRIYLTFSHFHNSGVFKMELDECTLKDKDNNQCLDFLLKLHSLCGELTEVFDKMRDGK